ncbi:uncharacterized protein LOC134851688 isoform X2 [Symsagittifera roscoffensis]|uniref:uncharacterized protein LOC134851688 isoform X2 n=1 Tax=Symsagittifera roscoffensis TaxID=84072 RepID=UPI00307C1E69
MRFQREGNSSEGNVTNNIGNGDQVFCTEKGCGVVGYKRESHVHIKGHLEWCDNNEASGADWLERIEMWDSDNFLHGGDDYMGKCEADVFNHLNCHYVGPVLLEGSSYTNPPDIYFKFYPIRHVCQRAGAESGCFFSTNDYIITPDFEDAKNCHVPSSLGIILTDKTRLDSLEPFPHYFELDATRNWVVWKCYVVLLLKERFPEFC